MKTKQIIVIRSDLKLRRGKECAQVAHAASMWLREFVLDPPCSGLTQEQTKWLEGNYRKIVVKGTEAEIQTLLGRCRALDLIAHFVVDDGLTECAPGTVTALAIGPHDEQSFVGLTDHLPLY